MCFMSSVCPRPALIDPSTPPPLPPHALKNQPKQESGSNLSLSAVPVALIKTSFLSSLL